jgi:hypothetical protein
LTVCQTWGLGYSYRELCRGGLSSSLDLFLYGIMVPEIAAYHELWDEEPKPLQAKQSDNEENSSEEQEMKVYLK